MVVDWWGIIYPTCLHASIHPPIHSTYYVPHSIIQLCHCMMLVLYYTLYIYIHIYIYVCIHRVSCLICFYHGIWGIITIPSRRSLFATSTWGCCEHSPAVFVSWRPFVKVAWLVQKMSCLSKSQFDLSFGQTPRTFGQVLHLLSLWSLRNLDHLGSHGRTWLKDLAQSILISCVVGS